jgi:hypothetical protein
VFARHLNIHGQSVNRLHQLWKEKDPKRSRKWVGRSHLPSASNVGGEHDRRAPKIEIAMDASE